MLLPPEEGLLGSVVQARITAAGRWSVTGEVVPAVMPPSTLEQAVPERRSSSSLQQGRR